MNFATIDHKIFFIINSYANYDEQIFGIRYVNYKTSKLRKSEFSILFFFPFFSLSIRFLP